MNTKDFDYYKNEILIPTNINSISNATLIPRETTRRTVHQLIRKSLLRKKGNSIFISENVLNGNLSGTYPSDIYIISSDLNILEDEVVSLQPGTEFLFDGQFSFNIYGTLQAIGTESDSIIFDNYSENSRWKGFLRTQVIESFWRTFSKIWTLRTL